MPIKFYCDKCEEEIDQKEGFGKFDVFKKQFTLRESQTVPTITEEVYYLCSECSEYLIKEIKNYPKGRS